MRTIPRRVLSVMLVLAVFSIPALAGAIGGLSGPLFGLATARNGDILVADAGVGIEVIHRNQVRSTIPLPGVTSVSPHGKHLLWATTGAGESPEADTGQALYRIWKGQPELVVNLFAFESEQNPDGNDPFDSNPYDVQALGKKAALVADAGGNDLLKVTDRGKVKVLAVFPDGLVSTENIKTLAGCPDSGADFCFLPDEMPAQSVPTSIAIGKDGYYYVGELRGFPGPTDASSIWRVSPRAKGEVCPNKYCKKVFDGGFTSIIDLAFHKGKLYVAELDEQSWAAVEIFQTGVGGTISECSLKKKTCEVVAEGIPQLTAITFDKRGHLWATQNSLVPNGAEVIKIR